jgi:hypothetical protein
MGIEPTLAAWEAAVLPLNYTRFTAPILFAFTIDQQVAAAWRQSAAVSLGLEANDWRRRCHY